MKLDILSVAEAELDDAIQYYEREQPGLGMRFHAEVSRALKRISEFPKAYQKFGARTQRCLVAKFPYGILYQHKERSNEILIVAIGHLHRAPDYWFSRKI
jgi:plasmid stabilization system protein ParE